MRRAALTTLLLGVVLQATAQIADPAQAAAIIAQLEDAPTSAARFNLLNGRDFVFDFNSGVGVARGAGGNITVANLADFPFLLGQGMSLAVGKMAPCGLSTPHNHPRATEFLYMISGSNLKVGFIQENGARFVSNVLNPGQGAIFPKGSTHFQANLDCDPVTFVAGLNSEDPGVGTVAQRFFGIPPDVADATLGGVGVDEVVRIAQSIPDTFALGVQACLDKCKIQRGDQPKNQQQPRVGGNEFPSTDHTGKPDDKGSDGQGNHWNDEGKNQMPPSNHSNNGNDGNSNNQPPPDKESENDWDSDEWYDDGKWDEKKWGDDKSKWNQGVNESKWDEEKWGHKNYDKEGGATPPSSHWWESGKTDNGQWDEKKWGDDKSKWNQGVDKSKWDEEKYGWKNYQKRSDVPEDRVTPTSAISSLISSANAQTLEELVFFLKLVLCVLLSGYVFVWVYFVVPTLRDRRLQAELRARAAPSPPVLVQDVKA